ncbi:ricin B-like lectin [Corynespora cassiicola Philippines]|uniref:Ricin B-like lectin n=1 Tax=Corynespora cassiicola Philippines TaxID=1448308 RepID=A0A2T2N946_CORCC|nr:ricin B-like lectin [Corynespora cassiicola Philippines]
MRYTSVLSLLTSVVYSSSSLPRGDIQANNVLGGSYQIMSGLGTYLTLDNNGLVTSNNVAAGDSQVWFVTTDDGGNAFIANKNGPVLTAIASRTQVHAGPFSPGNLAQAWIMTAADSGAYHIKSNEYDQLLDVESSNTTNGTPVLIWPDNGGTSNQKWFFNPVKA